jgi:hypothetical protein
MCVSLISMSPSCANAAGGIKRIAAMVSTPGTTTMQPIDGTSKKIPSGGISGAAFFEFDFLKNSEGGKAGLDENDIGTPQSAAYESILTATVKGNGAVNRAYLNEVRQGFRGLLAVETNSGQVFIMGTPESPAILRKYTRKFGNDLEVANVQELEFYYKSAIGCLEYDGTFTSLLD